VEATGRGAYHCITELERRRGWDPASMRVAVQGFGNVGRQVARLLHADGHRVVAVSDSRGGLYDPAGLDISRLARGVDASAGASVLEIGHGDRITNHELLELDVDLLVPAALGNVLTAANAAHVRARAVVEAANGPTSPDADALLADRGVIVVPDILANAGGVTVSWFEWVQNRAGVSWDLAEVHDRLRPVMVDAVDAVFAVAAAQGVDLRTAAYVLALRRLGAAMSAERPVTELGARAA
jgi:glutamate dehydrogenase (NADP+)